jgi:hypothetical protein
MPNWVQVQASVGVPGSNSNTVGGFILDMEMVNSSTQSLHIKQPSPADCPPGMQAVLVSAIAAYHSASGSLGNASAYNTTLQNATVNNGFLQFNTTPTPITPILQTTSVNGSKNSAGGGNSNGDESAIENQVLLISACLPNNSANKINQNNPNGNNLPESETAAQAAQTVRY